MWIEVYVSQNSEKVDKLVNILDTAQIISRVRCLKNNSESEGKCFEVLVPQTELAETQKIMVDSDLF